MMFFLLEISRVYFIMPFPGSQHGNTIDLAYWVGYNIWWLRILLLFPLLFLFIAVFKISKWPSKLLWSLPIGIYAVIFFLFNYRFEADKMFYQPKNKFFQVAAEDTTNKEQLVIGVEINGIAKAYPIQIIGYHHIIMDSVKGTPIMIKYCTVCRSGRGYSPVVDGKLQTFRLVGMDHYNALFEDNVTKSWWQQATGIAITGKLKGKILPEIPTSQLSLDTWLRKHPASLILQPDTLFKKNYKDLAGYDKGIIKGALEKRDSASWKSKSWVIGVTYDGKSKVFDWNDLVKKKVINDSLGNVPLLLVLENDNSSFHVYDRRIFGQAVEFESSNAFLIDKGTKSKWNFDGICIDGTQKGKALTSVQAYQEFWHSWNNFHPNTITAR